MITWGDVFHRWTRKGFDMAYAADKADAWQTVQQAIVHLHGAVHPTLCGIDIPGVRCTDDLSAVTCVHCRRIMQRLGVG